MPTVGKSYKNRTVRIPAELLRRVQVKLAKEDRKLNGLVVEQLALWATDDEADGWPPQDYPLQGCGQPGQGAPDGRAR